ncbi:Uncharacterized protein dnm_047810 [Desulfonema magnum]|uniref:Uncharacterized protein n=1 Tax=Desulfonema magnum TaxID=45655 RepID=A0A975BPD9_9BACT|nr:Uncharacterized protein dnm_047810 [Desulfonema magnum]
MCLLKFFDQLFVFAGFEDSDLKIRYYQQIESSEPVQSSGFRQFL